MQEFIKDIIETITDFIVPKQSSFARWSILLLIIAIGSIIIALMDKFDQ